VVLTLSYLTSFVNICDSKQTELQTVNQKDRHTVSCNHFKHAIFAWTLWHHYHNETIRCQTSSIFFPTHHEV